MIIWSLIASDHLNSRCNRNLQRGRQVINVYQSDQSDKSAQTNQNLPKYTIDSSALANKVPYPFFWKYASLKFQILFCTISWQQDWANITLTSFWNSTSDTPDFTWMIDDSNKVYCMNCAQANEVFFTGLYRWMCLPIWARWHQEAQCYDEQYMARLSCTIFQSAEPPILQHSQDNVFAP